MLKYLLIIIFSISFVQFTYAQKQTVEPKVEITLKDIYEELKNFEKEVRNDMIEIKQTLARHDEQLKAIDERLDAHFQMFWVLIGLLTGIFGFVFLKLNQIGERLSSLEILLTGDIKPAKQKVKEMALQREKEIEMLKSEIEKLKSVLHKANLM